MMCNFYGNIYFHSNLGEIHARFYVLSNLRQSAWHPLKLNWPLVFIYKSVPNICTARESKHIKKSKSTYHDLLPHSTCTRCNIFYRPPPTWWRYRCTSYNTATTIVTVTTDHAGRPSAGRGSRCNLSLVMWWWWLIIRYAPPPLMSSRLPCCPVYTLILNHRYMEEVRFIFTYSSNTVAIKSIHCNWIHIACTTNVAQILFYLSTARYWMVVDG